MDLPAEFIENIKLHISDSGNFFDSLQYDYLKGFRVNPLKCNEDSLPHYLGGDFQGTKWCPTGYYYAGEEIGKSHFYSAGGLYIQEPSAMLPVSALPVCKGDFVLDLCAAPGGKSTFIGEKLNGTGLLVANDISHSRCRPLLKNIERHGIAGACLLNEDSEKLKMVFPGFFDIVLLDAPCSGEGMFRKDPKAIRSWLEKGPASYRPLQEKLIADAALMLKPGGLLAYSTCTFNTLENEELIQGFLAAHEDFRPFPIDHDALGLSRGLMDLDFCGRIWPHRQKGEGHFLAILQKEGIALGGPSKALKEDAPGENLQRAQEFLDAHIYKDLPGKMMAYKDSIMLVSPHLPDLKGIRVFRSGMNIGSLKDNRFEPSQALAMYLKKDLVKNALSFPAGHVNTAKYLRGESLDGPAGRGWHLFCMDELPLGWVKSDGRRLKNKLAKGWINP